MRDTGGDPRGKVILLVSFMNKAGAQRAAHRTAVGLRERGWDSELWFLYKVSDDDFSGCPTRVFLDRASPGALGYLKILFAVLVAMFRARPQAVITFLPLASLIGHTASFLAGCRIRVASLRSPGTTFDTPMRQLDRLYGTIGLYTSIISVSQAVVDEAASYPAAYRKRLRVVYNGVDPVACDLTKQEARARLGIDQDAKIALSVGRIARQKNYPFQVEIARHLKDTQLICVGDGPDRTAIEAAIAEAGVGERMRLLGTLSTNDIAMAYKAADMFVQPSLFEGQSNTLLEAMSAGLPVIVSDVPSQTETAIGWEDGNGPYGRALPLDDPALWADAIERITGDKGERARWAERARRRAGHFTVAAQIDGFEAELRDTKPLKNATGGEAVAIQK